MNMENPSAPLEKDPQVQHSWNEYKGRLERVKEVRKIADLMDSLSLNSGQTGSEILHASIGMEDSLEKMVKAADGREQQIRKDIARLLLNTYGDKIGFRINPDGSLELNNGLVYE